MKNPVLILGAGLRLTLVIARSLHRRGVPVFVAPTMIGEPPIQSKAIQQHIILPDFKSAPDDFINQMIALIKREGIDMIIPTGDGAIASIAQHYDLLNQLVHIGSPPPHITDRVLDKRITLAAAQKCGVPVAASVTIDHVSGINDAIKHLRYPLIAKPAIRKGANTYRIKYFLTQEELFTSVKNDADWLQGGLLQEYIPGTGKGIGVLMHKGSSLAMFQHRRLKEYPYTGGVSVMAESETVDPILGNFAIRLLQEIEWEGIAMVEYRYNPNDNSFALMEINGRYWGSLFLAERSGMDFPYYEWQLAHGEKPSIPENYAVGRRARWLAGDILRLHSILDGTHRSEIVSVSPYKELWRFFMDFNFRTRDAVFSLHDPMPAIQEFKETTGALFKKDAKRIISGILPKSLSAQIRIYRNLPSHSRSVFAIQQARRFLGRQPILFRGNKNGISNILFVCLGNIIRSPTAAIALKKALYLAGESEFIIESAGMWEGLNRVDPRPSPEIVVKVATELGIGLAEHRSRPITQELVETADVIFVMDYENEAMLLKRYPEARQKTFLLGACIEKVPVMQWLIADPYGKTADEIRESLVTINNRVQSLTKLLVAN
ncbi:MAG TPA: ATP-grasp domain-containing protein [Nitrosomonas nitrosa]|nr:ATP-grasp domain-containing protein [Nitrosomonas nitrosa]